MKFERVGPGHPEACQGSIKTGRCPYRAAPGARNCYLHGGGASSASHQRQELRNYKLQAIHSQRTGELAGSSHIKDLTDEIALLRYSLEQVFKQLNSPVDFILYTDKIKGIISEIKNLVESTQKLQERNKELIDRDTLMGIADTILTIVLDHVQDPDVRQAVGLNIYEAIAQGFSGEVP